MTRKIDHAAVLASYAETQNAQETARRLGVHENSVHAIVRKNRGECVRCRAPAPHGKTMCESCLAADRKRIKERRKKRRHEGVCMECGAPRELGTYFCATHRNNAVKRNAAYDERQRMRGVPRGFANNPRQKRRRMIEKYGIAAWDRWQHIGGKCEACAAEYGDAAIHLHHIDENPKNDAPENYVFLCYACHRAVHLLLASKDRMGLIAWFSKTYPLHPIR